MNEWKPNPRHAYRNMPVWQQRQLRLRLWIKDHGLRTTLIGAAVIAALAGLGIWGRGDLLAGPPRAFRSTVSVTSDDVRWHGSILRYRSQPIVAVASNWEFSWGYICPAHTHWHLAAQLVDESGKGQTTIWTDKATSPQPRVVRALVPVHVKGRFRFAITASTICYWGFSAPPVPLDQIGAV